MDEKLRDRLKVRRRKKLREKGMERSGREDKKEGWNER